MKRLALIVSLCLVTVWLSLLAQTPTPNLGIKTTLVWDPPAGATFLPGDWLDADGKKTTITACELGIFPIGSPAVLGITTPIAKYALSGIDGATGVLAPAGVATLVPGVYKAALRVSDSLGTWSDWGQPIVAIVVSVKPMAPATLRLQSVIAVGG